MTQPDVVVATELVLVDADGQITEDRTAAVRGEVVETLADGSTRSILFEIDRSDTAAG